MSKSIMLMTLALLFVSIFAGAFNIQTVRASPGTIYIRADGSIDPPTAPISTADNLTYTFTASIYTDEQVPSAIEVQRSDITVDGNGYTLEGNGEFGFGFNLHNTVNVTITNVTIRDFYFGIFINSSSCSIICGNTIAGDYFGIGLTHSNCSLIMENKVVDNYDGIHLSMSSNNSVVGNVVTSNYHGINLQYSSENSICGNNVTAGEWYGILLNVGSSNNRVSENIIANNGYQQAFAGLSVWGNSSNNIIYHNNLINNSAKVDDSVNIWDDGYPSGGNYWSDYSGVDMCNGRYQNITGGDSIGDSPHIINENNQDRYPLMRPYGTPIPGDVNLDGTVDIFDIVIVALEFGHPPPPIVDLRADVNKDGLVDIFDIVIVALHFGETG